MHIDFFVVAFVEYHHFLFIEVNNTCGDGWFVFKSEEVVQLKYTMFVGDYKALWLGLFWFLESSVQCNFLGNICCRFGMPEESLQLAGEFLLHAFGVSTRTGLIFEHIEHGF